MLATGQERAELTARQKEILAFIQARIHDDGMPPTHDEIKDAFGLRSAFGVRQHLRLIRDKGHIQLFPGMSRGIRISRVAPEVPTLTRQIPVLGRIAAGEPILAEEHVEGWITVDDELYPRGGLFALRVQGDSMVNVGINSGDLAVVRQQPRVENGQIAAVQRGDEATLKRVYTYTGRMVLKAENDTVSDICIENDPSTVVRVLGLYVGLIRQASQHGMRHVQ